MNPPMAMATSRLANPSIAGREVIMPFAFFHLLLIPVSEPLEKNREKTRMRKSPKNVQ